MSTTSEKWCYTQTLVIILTVYIFYIVYKIVLTLGPSVTSLFVYLFNKYLLIEVKHSDRLERKDINSEQGNLRLLLSMKWSLKDK